MAERLKASDKATSSAGDPGSNPAQGLLIKLFIIIGVILIIIGFYSRFVNFFCLHVFGYGASECNACTVFGEE